MPRNSLLPNYGWVQNTSNLSTVRDTIELVPDEGILHIDLRDNIISVRRQQGHAFKSGSWDARCRIKAIHATGLVTLNRHIQGYDLTELGRQLKVAAKSDRYFRRKRMLSQGEIDIFRKGLLTNPPVIRILDLLNQDRQGSNAGLSKYDLGGQLGFVGDTGFTHIDPYWVAKNGLSFNDKEGDADKWARTILSWLKQVGWVADGDKKEFGGRTLQLFKSEPEVNNVLRYDALRIARNVPSEMLCSHHHTFEKLLQKRRTIVIDCLNSETTLDSIVTRLSSENIQANPDTVKFDIIGLENSGFRIEESGGYYKHKDSIVLDVHEVADVGDAEAEETEALIKKLVVEYEDTIPPKYVDHLIRFGYDGNEGTRFEGIVAEYFRFIGYETDYLGQGKGRVTDVIAKYKNPHVYAKSYGLIIDAKATSGQYSFPVGDKRKMKEYIRKHGPELLKEGIPNHAFSFVSSDFISEICKHLDEIKEDTEIYGAAISVETLLKLGDSLRTQRLSIEDIYPRFTTNQLFQV